MKKAIKGICVSLFAIPFFFTVFSLLDGDYLKAEGNGGHEASSPPLIPVSAGLVPVDDGAFRIVILTNSSVGDPPSPNYCAPGWSHGFIQKRYVNQSTSNVANGCWAADSSDPNAAKITFRFYNIESVSVREFVIDAKKMKKFLWEWRTDRLFSEK